MGSMSEQFAWRSKLETTGDAMKNQSWYSKNLSAKNKTQFHEH